MPTLTSRDGMALQYSLEGSGPPVLLHLGAGCDADLWRAAGHLKPLSQEFTCILFDHRGHGQSDHPRGPEANHVDRYAADVFELLDALGLPSVGFWGYSNGISVGMRVGELAPARLRALVGSGTIGRRTPAELASMVSQSIAEYRQHGWEKMIAGFEEEEGEVPSWMKERIRSTDIEPVIGWSESRLTWGWSAWEALSRVQTPTLFVVGELEDPHDTMAEAVALMRDGRRVRVPGKGHINAFLDAEFVLPHVRQFLSLNGRS